jgi:hypothetical protein
VATERVGPVIVLVPSTLLGPAVWEPVATVLRQRGHEVIVPSLREAVRTPADVLDQLRGTVPADVPVVLVPHSNAGLYVAALATDRTVTAIVFVDARLPSDEPATATAPPDFRAHLATLVEPDGRLPGWTEWWPEDEVAELFPDPSTRARVEAEQPRLPLAYFDDTVPSPPGWETLPAAYLAFSDAYAPERAEAERRGWPARSLEGGHLHMLVDPEAVAGELAALLDRLER